MFRSLTGEAALLAASLAHARPVPAWREAFYRAVWRWHFLAGLVCLPFLVLLSATGALYLFKDELNTTLFPARTLVAVRAHAPLGPDRLIFNALQAVPTGLPVSYTEPAAADRSALVTLQGTAGRTLVYLDPYTGDVLDRVVADREFFGVVRRLHSLAYFGPVANALVEIVAGFSVILVLTGAYLWWPRGRGPALALRAGPGRRVWWRDLHALAGLLGGAGLLFLALSGLPWSIWWGQQLRTWSNAAGLGQPQVQWAGQPHSTVPLKAVLGEPGWTVQDAPLPLSVGPERAAAEPLGIDSAAALLRAMGMPAGFELALPVGETGVYAAAVYPRDVFGQRVVALDQYSGRLVLDVGYGDLGPVGRTIQLGIGLHKGEFWGRANQLAMLAFCLATILLCVSAATMWWWRRPPGRLGAPPRPRDPRAGGTVAALVIGLGALFPLTGLAILVMLALDRAAGALGRRADA